MLKKDEDFSQDIPFLKNVKKNPPTRKSAENETVKNAMKHIHHKNTRNRNNCKYYSFHKKTCILLQN